jgi:hypothetical protein
MRIEWSSFFSYNLKHGDELTLQVKMYVDWLLMSFVSSIFEVAHKNSGQYQCERIRQYFSWKSRQNLRENFDLQACKE